MASSINHNTIQDFELFIKKLRKIILRLMKNNEIAPKYISKPINTTTTKINDDGYWEFGVSNPEEEKIEHWEWNIVPIIFKNLAKEEQELYSPYISRIIFSLLNKDKKRLADIKKEYQKVINKQTLYNIHTFNTLGCMLLSPQFSIQIYNKDNIPVQINFIPISPEDIQEVLINKVNHFHPTSVDLMTYGLKIQSIIPQDIETKTLEFEKVKLPFQNDRNINISFRECEIAERILKLLKPSTINSFSWTYKTEGQKCISPFGAVPIKNVSYNSIIYKSDRTLLKKDYEFFYKKLVEYKVINYLKEKAVISPLFVALEKYEEALNVSALEFEKALTYIIMGLEALYTAKDDNLAYALRMRVATLLNLINQQSENILEIIKIAYNIRSDYSHGATNREKLTNKLLDKFNSSKAKYDCLIYFLNILRISIVSALILDMGKNVSKKENNVNIFQEMLDNTMIGNKTISKEFKEKLNNFKGWLQLESP